MSHGRPSERPQPCSVRDKVPSAVDYLMLAQSAKAAKLIDDVLPFDQCTFYVKEMNTTRSNTTSYAKYGMTRAFDRMFCEMLREGIEDPLVVLLVALLPNVTEMVLDGVPGDTLSLRWQPNHGFSALRKLTACAIDGERPWPIEFFRTLLVQSKLESLKVSHATSWSRAGGERDPSGNTILSLSLPPKAFALQHIELESCTLHVLDLRALLDACCRLRSFLYTTADLGVGSSRFSPGRLVGLLEAHKNTLEYLVFDLDIHRAESTSSNQIDLIQSLSHMTALKVLVTPPEMWYGVGAEEDATIHHDDVSEAQCLSSRMPPNLEMLVFGLSKRERTTSLRQLSSLLRTRSAILPRLATLCIGGVAQEYVNQVKQLALDLTPVSPARSSVLRVEVRPEYVGSVFDSMQHVHSPDDTRWTNGKYATIPAHHSLFLRTYERIRNEHGLPAAALSL
ncbi:ring finger domain protein [Stemphylium lycopersici]|uniref:Ring finger domain protein n=1 Tax=Stemphylium lycopersici TaxID=183478 RepID=A0A364MTG4_STELY|nr:ring finger domain protein [Stemphylium lycopersici]